MTRYLSQNTNTTLSYVSRVNKLWIKKKYEVSHECLVLKDDSTASHHLDSP